MSKKLRGPAVNISFDSRAIPVMIDGIANTIFETMKKITEFKDQRSLWLASLPEEQRATVMGMHHQHQCDCHQHEEQQYPQEDLTLSKEQLRNMSINDEHEQQKHACSHRNIDGRDAVVLDGVGIVRCPICNEWWDTDGINEMEVAKAVDLLIATINKCIWLGNFDQSTVDQLSTLKKQLGEIPKTVAEAEEYFNNSLKNCGKGAKAAEDHEQQVVKQFRDDVRDLENKYGKYVEDLPRASAEEDFDDDDGSYWDDGCPSCDDEDGDKFSDDDSGIHEDLSDHYRKRVHELYGDHHDGSDKVTAMARDIISSIKNTGIDPMVLLNKVRELWKEE